jgi:putative toxin-antitoxin system antitoxin component (TIGR02293 family)
MEVAVATPRKASNVPPRQGGKGVAALVAGSRSRTSESAAAIQTRQGRTERSWAQLQRVNAPAVFLVYEPKKGVDEYVRIVISATPKEIIATERRGVQSQLLKDLSKRIQLPATRIFDMVGIPKATAEKKVAAGELVAGSGGQAALGVIKLLGIAQDLIASSTAKEARDFDAGKWLGQWLERPQPALGGEKPADLLDTPTGIDIVSRLLGSIGSGAYQ